MDAPATSAAMVEALAAKLGLDATGSDQPLLRGLAEAALEAHGGDAARALISLGGEGAGRQGEEGGGSFVLGPPPAAEERRRAADQGEGACGVTDEHADRYGFVDPVTGQEVPDRAAAELGRGGIGRVLLALDRHLGRTVAMKELLSGSGTPGGPGGPRARFLREARVTGQLEHPSIVPVYELGRRADGTFFYTMRRVRGQSLADHLRGCRGLAERLALLPRFLELCQALAYAHSRGVIHRDLKPENVMLGGFGETVVLDWGLAKARGQEDLRGGELRQGLERLQGVESGATRAGDVLGTPLYMSPEQADGQLEAIDERSDVWGLGAVLFELLTGRTPYQGYSVFEILGKLLKDPVPAVRSLCPEAPAELCAIAERALEKDPAARYRDAGELAEEIGAYLAGRRVVAHEYDLGELLGRFLRRNWIASTVVLAGVALLAGVLVWAYLGVTAQRDQARGQRQAAARFAGFLVGELFDRIRPLSGSTPALQLITERSMRFYDSQGDPPPDAVEERRGLSAALRKVSDLALRMNQSAVALTASRRAEALLADLPPARLARTELLLEVVAARVQTASVLREAGDTEAQRAALEASIAALRPAASRGDDPRLREALAKVLCLASDAERDAGQTATATRLALEGEALVRPAVAARPDDADAIRRLDQVLDRLSRLAQDRGDSAAALRHRREDLALASRLLELRPEEAQQRIDLSISLRSLSELEENLGQPEEAEAHLRRSSDLLREVSRADPGNLDLQGRAALRDTQLAAFLARRGRHAEARAVLGPALETCERLAAHDASSYYNQINLSVALDQAGDLAEVDGDFARARAYFERAVALDQAQLARDPDSHVLLFNLGISYGKLARTCLLGDDAEGAARWLDRLVEQSARVVERAPGNLDTWVNRADALRTRGLLWAATGDLSQAAEALARAREAVQRALGMNPADLDVLVQRCVIELAQGDLDLARGDAGAARLRYASTLEGQAMPAAQASDNLDLRWCRADLLGRVGRRAERRALLVGLIAELPEEPLLGQSLALAWVPDDPRQALRLLRAAGPAEGSGPHSRVLLRVLEVLAASLVGRTAQAREAALSAAALLDDLRGPLPWEPWRLVEWQAWAGELRGPRQARLRAVVEAAVGWNLGAGPAPLAASLRALAGGR